MCSSDLFLDFTWFREQTCLVACPYGRWQSVLLDQSSLIVAYDVNRGEPRGKPKDNAAVARGGDCVDCNACVLTCPTGIDIRDGLQMECIHCTQCADACDAMMVKVGRPTGLIRYTSQDALAGQVRRLLRPRTVLYPLAFVSEHSETLVELDIEYRELAEEKGVHTYVRVPTVGTHPHFIAGLARLVRHAL